MHYFLTPSLHVSVKGEAKAKQKADNDTDDEIGHAGTEPDKPVITVQLELPKIAVTFAREASVERVPGCTNMRAPCAAVVPTPEPAI